jgi:hypothetical protein
MRKRPRKDASWKKYGGKAVLRIKGIVNGCTTSLPLCKHRQSTKENSVEVLRIRIENSDRIREIEREDSLFLPQYTLLIDLAG